MAERNDGKFIDIIINPDGTVDLESINFEGPECQKLLDKFQRMIGAQIDSEKKPEFFIRKEGVSEREKERG